MGELDAVLPADPPVHAPRTSALAPKTPPAPAIALDGGRHSARSRPSPALRRDSGAPASSRGSGPRPPPPRCRRPPSKEPPPLPRPHGCLSTLISGRGEEVQYSRQLVGRQGESSKHKSALCRELPTIANFHYLLPLSAADQTSDASVSQGSKPKTNASALQRNGVPPSGHDRCRVRPPDLPAPVVLQIFVALRPYSSPVVSPDARFTSITRPANEHWFWFRVHRSARARRILRSPCCGRDSRKAAVSPGPKNRPKNDARQRDSTPQPARMSSVRAAQAGYEECPMTELIFPRRSGERISHDSRSYDAANAWCDRSECAFRSVVRPCAARALRAGLVLVSALGALSVAAGNAHGQPTLARLRQLTHVFRRFS